MSDLRQAAQQALEALLAAWQHNPHWQTNDAITALLKALAQPEPRNQCGETCERAKLCAVCARGLDGATRTPCDIAEDGVCEVIDCCRNPPQILEALEIGYDSAQAEAAQYHAAMAGYRPERHAQMDADVAKIAAAITAVKAALAQEEQEPVRAESVTTPPCKGMNCGAIDGRSHSLECHAEHSAAIAGGRFVPLPRCEWQGLTEEDMEDLLPLYSDPSANTEMLEFAAAIEVKLKEKNHG
jgi:hypothetical protein